MLERRQATGIAALLAFLAAALYFATAWVAIPFVVAGPSMEPTLSPGDHVLVDVWSYRHRLPRPGEIVLFRGPGADGGAMVKRVVASSRFPDDRPDPRLWGPRAGDGPSIRVLGDGASSSTDSRSFGPVPASRVVGRVVWRYWPLSRAGTLAGTAPGAFTPPPGR